MPLASVAPIMQQAMVAAEDMRFYEHHGVDVKGVARAFVANSQANETAQGASTLTMQYVRQAHRVLGDHPAAGRRRHLGHAGPQAAGDALRAGLEKQLTKQQILERYLNLAPFGNSAFGIYAASEVYFGKTPKDLDAARGGAAGRPGQGAQQLDPMTDEGRPNR